MSVVVPTRDRSGQLARCLAALSRQTARDDNLLEVVVVDDGSEAAHEVATLAATVGAKLVRRSGGGPAAARNAGVVVAEGDVVLFVDDDCIPDADWARRLASAISTSGGDAVGGLTLPADESSPAAVANETIASYASRAAGFLATNNVGCSRALAARFPFDERLRFGEDREWCGRLVQGARTLRREESAVVRHAVEPGIAVLVRRHFGYGVASRTVGRTSAGADGGSPSFYAGLLRAGFARGVRVGGLVCLAQAATAAGYVMGTTS